MVSLRGKGSESQDRLNLKGEIIMQINGNVYTKREKKETCMFGKLEWRCNYSVKNTSDEVDVDEVDHARVTVIFEGLSCSKLLMVYLMITESSIPLQYAKDHNAIKIPGMRVRVNSNINKEIFIKAMRQVFAIAFAESKKKYNLFMTK